MFQAELAAFLDMSNGHGHHGGHHHHHGHHGGRSNFTFDSLGLTVTRIENVVLFVDGVEVSATDDPVTALNDAASITEGDIDVAGNVLANDTVPDLVARVSVTAAPAYGTVTLGADGAYLFTLNNDAPQIDGLSEGETLVDSFSYTVTDANGDTATATVEITITGQNDAPPALEGILNAGEDDGLVSYDLQLLFFDDVDNEDDATTLTYTASVAAGNGTVEISDARSMISFLGDDFQALNDGETCDVVITVVGTDARGASLSTNVTVTVTGSDDNTAPTFVYAPNTQPDASVGTLVFDGSDDLSVWFTDPEGDALTFTADGLPEGLVLGADGVLSIDETSNVISVADQDITITATDAMGAATRVTLTLTSAMANSFESSVDNPFATNETVAITGSSLADNINFGSNAGRSGTITVDSGDGADGIRFGASAGENGMVTANGEAGSDVIGFGLSAGVNGTAIANGGESDDAISFGFNAGIVGTLTADGGEGDDFITFEKNAANDRGQLTVDGGAGDDFISFGSEAGANGGRITVNGGDGADTIQFGPGAENLAINLGANDGDADTLVFLGTVENATIANWEEGIDIVDVASPELWTGTDNGTDTSLPMVEVPSHSWM